MARLKIPSPIADHIMAQKDIEILARNLQDWLRQSRQTTRR
jgi:hypothetical protein